MNFTEEEKEFFMKEALKEAQKAAENEEVPIGVVIVKDGEIIARDFNRRELDGRATHHAEVCAIEPCVMCAGAIGLARIPQVYFGATNPKFGGTVSLYQILEDKRLNHRVQVESGILEDECAKIMQDFFKNRRKK